MQGFAAKTQVEKWTNHYRISTYPHFVCQSRRYAAMASYKDLCVHQHVYCVSVDQSSVAGEGTCSIYAAAHKVEVTVPILKPPPLYVFSGGEDKGVRTYNGQPDVQAGMRSRDESHIVWTCDDSQGVSAPRKETPQYTSPNSKPNK
jgi:hypothetical protein